MKTKTWKEEMKRLEQELLSSDKHEIEHEGEVLTFTTDTYFKAPYYSIVSEELPNLLLFGDDLPKVKGDIFEVVKLILETGGKIKKVKNDN